VRLQLHAADTNTTRFGPPDRLRYELFDRIRVPKAELGRLAQMPVMGVLAVWWQLHHAVDTRPPQEHFRCKYLGIELHIIHQYFH